MDRVHFIMHKGISVLLIDLSDCTPEQGITVANEVKRVVTRQPKGSVLTLSDFTGVTVNRDVLTRMKEVATYDRPYVKRAAIVGAESIPEAYHVAMKEFSQREFPRFASREAALDWLVEEPGENVTS